MFKKLHTVNEDSQYTLNQNSKIQETTYKKNFVKSGNSRRKNSSYGEKFRKKNHLLPQVPDLQIVQSDTFIFQGRMASIIEGGSSLATGSQKHGEGVMFLKNGTLIIGFWDHGLLHGRAMIFTPFGGKTIAEYYNGNIFVIQGRLNGWAITLFSDKLVVCAAYYDNKIDGQKIIFDSNEKMWVGSRYSEEAKSFKIIHVAKGTINELPDFFKLSKSSNDLTDLYEDFVNNEKCCMLLNEIQFVSLTQNLSYIGYGNEENHPNGLGAIYGKNQFYLGHFRDGSLECYGRMIFENGQIYQGELLNGVFYGQGVYYNPSKNVSTIMSTNRDQQKILDEQEGYICINPQLNYFKYQKNGQTGMVGDGLGSICEIIEKYYSRFYIEMKQQNSENENTNSEFGVSENVDDVDEPISKAEEQARKRKTPNENKNQNDQSKRWVNLNSKGSNLNEEEKSFGASGYEQNEDYRERAYSLDKREAPHIRNHLAQKSMPFNFQDFKNHSNIHDQSLQQEFNKLKLNRNFTSGERKATNVKFPDTTKIKENIHPKQAQYMKESSYHGYGQSNVFEVTNPNKNTLNVTEKGHNLSTEEAMTFRNKNLALTELKSLQESKFERKYQQIVESNVLSPQQSVVSNLSHKVEGMVNKTGSKRKKIFM